MSSNSEYQELETSFGVSWGDSKNPTVTLSMPERQPGRLLRFLGNKTGADLAEYSWRWGRSRPHTFKLGIILEPDGKAATLLTISDIKTGAMRVFSQVIEEMRAALSSGDAEQRELYRSSFFN